MRMLPNVMRHSSEERAAVIFKTKIKLLEKSNTNNVVNIIIERKNIVTQIAGGRNFCVVPRWLKEVECYLANFPSPPQSPFLPRNT